MKFVSIKLIAKMPIEMLTEDLSIHASFQVAYKVNKTKIINAKR